MGSTLFGYLALARIPNGLIAFFFVLMAAVVGTRSFHVEASVILGAGIVWLVLSGGNALNDYFDRDIDRINRPKRPLPSGLISGRSALVFSIGLLSLGSGLSLFLGLRAAAFVAGNTLLLAVYARFSKSLGLLANLTVGWLTGSVFLFVAVIQGYLTGIILTLFLSAFFSMTSREILKDIEDMEGDRKLGAATLPIRIGPRRARIAATLSSLPAVPLICRAYILHGMNAAFPVFAAAAAATVVCSFFFAPRTAQRALKAAVVLVLLAFYFGVL